MDMLAQRAGVAALILLATAGSAFAWGLGRFASSVDRPDTPRLRMDAALKQPKASLFAAMATPRPLVLDAVAPETKPDLATAFGKALGTPQPKAARRPKTADIPAGNAVSARDRDDSAEPRPDDLLDFGPDASDREAKLADRSAKAFSVRQPGGAEQEHKLVSARGERVTFETDLAKPGDY